MSIATSDKGASSIQTVRDFEQPKFSKQLDKTRNLYAAGLVCA